MLGIAIGIFNCSVAAPEIQRARVMFMRENLTERCPDADRQRFAGPDLLC